MEVVIFVASSVVPPALAFVFNLVARGKKALVSGGADWLLLLFAFDLTCLISVSSVEPFLAYPPFRDMASGVFGVGMSCSILAWLVLVFRVEGVGRRSEVFSPPSPNLLALLIGWVFAVFMTFLHFAIFLYKG